MGEFDAPGSLWQPSEIIDTWGYAQAIDRIDLDLRNIADIAGRAAEDAVVENSVPDIDISPEILDKLLLLASQGYLKLNGEKTTTHDIYAYVEALSGNEVIYARYVDEEDDTKSLVRVCDLSNEDVPLINDSDDSDGSIYKLCGVYTSQEEAEGEM
ncbi:hypothetical protein C0416_04190 [bacterium]|nr:hypothetical protein [bacterium]